MSALGHPVAKTSREAAAAYRALKAEQRSQPSNEQWKYGERLRALRAAFTVLSEEESFGIRR